MPWWTMVVFCRAGMSSLFSKSGQMVLTMTLHLTACPSCQLNLLLIMAVFCTDWEWGLFAAPHVQLISICSIYHYYKRYHYLFTERHTAGSLSPKSLKATDSERKLQLEFEQEQPHSRCEAFNAKQILCLIAVTTNNVIQWKGCRQNWGGAKSSVLWHRFRLR